MIGIVVVSHSPKLAAGVRELAEQMTRGTVPLEAVGGIDDPDNPIGTDPMHVLSAIETVAAKADGGVLVLMDLGSALLSAETALDFLADPVKAQVRLCAAPLVEGTVAAAVQAAAGASLDAAAREAAGALEAKRQQLSPVTGDAPAQSAPAAAPPDIAGETLRLELVIANKLGLHARPAANLVATAGKFRAAIQLAKGARSANAKSINQVALLAGKRGDTVTLTATGPDAAQALEALDALHRDRFGERDEDVSVAPAGENCRTVADGTITGSSASAGYAVGPACVHQAKLPQVGRRETTDPEGQIRKLDQAIAAARAQIETLRRETEQTSGKAAAAIFGVHDLILGDAALRDKAAERIDTEHLEAAYAWSVAVRDMADAYRRLDDAYMRARAADVLDCGGRVLRLLIGEAHVVLRLDRPSIVVAHDLSPSDVAGLDPALVLGFVTEAGGATSHAAILARSLGIAAVIGVKGCLGRIADGQILALDAVAGTVWTAPTKAVREDIAAKRQAWLTAREKAKAKGAAPARTMDGLAIPILGNIGQPEEAAGVLDYGAEGVGLFRTEFLFQDRDQAPDEDEQVAAYLAAARAMAGRPVVVRTLDTGGDKPIRYLPMPREANPSLGERGVRFCLARPELFRTQLRALLRAAADAPIRILYPMVSDARELADIRAFQTRVGEELAREGTRAATQVSTGIMIEVPSAVAVADKLAGLCDFFSIGTNDLAQYVMAADRGNVAVAALCDSLHPAVLHMIALTCRAAKAAAIPVAMCGELAGDSKAAPLLLGLGLDELSMNGPAIADVKEAIRSVNMATCRALAAQALEAVTGDAVRELLGAAPRHAS